MSADSWQGASYLDELPVVAHAPGVLTDERQTKKTRELILENRRGLSSGLLRVASKLKVSIISAV